MKSKNEIFSVTDMDLTRLLKPIEKKNPSGKWARYDNRYLSILSEKNADDPTLPMGEWERPLKQTDWKKVVNISSELLQTETKDLSICIFLIQGWTSLAGMEGLKFGLLLMFQLTEKYWDTLWPKYDVTDPESRIAPYKWLATKGPDFLMENIVLLPSNKGREKEFNYLDYLKIKNRVLTLTNQLERQDSPPINSKISDIHVQKDDTSYLKDLDLNTNESIEIVKKIDSFLDEKLGSEAISFVKMLTFLTEIEFFNNKIKSELPKEGANMVEGSSPMEQTISKDGLQQDLKILVGEEQKKNSRVAVEKRPLLAKNERDQRNEIYENIRDLSKKLRAIEPHSPSSYVLRRVAIWENMTLEELVEDIGKFDGTLKGIISTFEEKSDQDK
tara:strand:- start:218 stop:1378 length:1161 start_codon:yes stop_codon:yes gene_type:complete